MVAHLDRFDGDERRRDSRLARHFLGPRAPAMSGARETVASATWQAWKLWQVLGLGELVRSVVTSEYEALYYRREEAPVGLT